VQPDGRVVGVVAVVVFGPGQDRLRIEMEGGGPAFEVPFVDALVPRVDLGAGEIEIDPIPGLIEP
jgi:16S rRNA processing protein RimM